ncbi:MAG: methyltransferase domain-containing protein [Chthoniobacterales bacterium]
MQTILRKLNLGCGQFKLPDHHNVDAWPEADPDQLIDLDQYPLPFAGGSFDEVRADHVLEHLHDPFGMMRELHRVCSEGALIRIKVPHFSRGMTHADHKRCFDVTFPYYFRRSFGPGYMGCEMELQYQRLRWFGQPYMKRGAMPAALYWGGRIAGAVIDFFANLSLLFCSRIWCFWVGGFEEYELHFRVVKR